MIEYILRASMERNWVITIMYDTGEEITIRNIKVLQIEGDSIKAFCYLRGEKRRFKKENILSAAFHDRKSMPEIKVGV